MFLSRTITAPTLARRQVERSATSRVMVMKYWSQGGRSLIPSLLYDADRLGDEGDEEQREAEHGTAPAPRVEWLRVVQRRGMTEKQHGGRDHAPYDPERRPRERKPDQRREEEEWEQYRPVPPRGGEEGPASER